MHHQSNHATYEIITDGQLNFKAPDHFVCTSLDTSPQQTNMTVVVSDQTELHGILSLMRDYNVTLISIQRVEVFDDGVGRAKQKKQSHLDDDSVAL